MALDTVSISDVGASLIAIEAEFKSNLSSIQYHKETIAQYEVKNNALKELMRSLLLTALPNTTRGY